MADSLRSISTRRTAQNIQADSRQVKNNAGGFVFQLTPKAQLRRFLILGVDGGTYYQTATALAADNAKVVFELARSNPSLVVNEIRDVAETGAAARANASLFALAIVSAPAHNSDVVSRTEALNLLPEVARTATQLFIFLNYSQQFRGWGVGLRNAVDSWYQSRSLERMEYQIVKYRQREGWTHRDVFRQAHPKARSEEENNLFKYVTSGEIPSGFSLIEGYEKAKTAAVADLPDLVREYKLTWEMLPDEGLANANVWRAMLDNGMPQTALMRQLPRLTNLDVLQGEYRKLVVNQLSDTDAIRKGRIHPMNVLFALTTYASGQGFRGTSTWSPVRGVVDALDSAFYSAFKNVKPSGKRHLLALDVSGSMVTRIMNSNLSAREASVAMAMVTAASEEDYAVVGFTSSSRGYGRWDAAPALKSLDVSPRRRLDDNVAAVSRLSFGGTDCALPMVYAKHKKLEVDQFVIYTDSETWHGAIHPHQALREYRDSSGIDAKLVVVGMTSTGFSIADPSDPGMLDVVGFDATAPALMSEFARGNV